MSTAVTEWPAVTYKELEPGIWQLVRALHRLGVMTVMSCEGHIRTHWFYVGILPWPWIIIQTDASKIQEVNARIIDWNTHNPGRPWQMSQKRIHGSFTPEYIAREMLREYPGTLVRALVPVEENPKLSAEVLAELQVGIPDFASFLERSS